MDQVSQSFPRPRKGVAPVAWHPDKCDTLAGSYIFYAVFFPGVFGTSCLDHRAIYANHQTFWVEILCGLILLSYFDVVIGVI